MISTFIPVSRANLVKVAISVIRFHTRPVPGPVSLGRDDPAEMVQLFHQILGHTGTVGLIPDKAGVETSAVWRQKPGPSGSAAAP